MNLSNLSETVEKAKHALQGFEQEFFVRMWSSNLDVYRKRLSVISFENLNHVLDAGAGNGQWTICMAEKNKQVTAIDYTQSRVNVLSILQQDLGISNLKVEQGNTENLHFPDNSFDGLFSYSVVYLTDYRKTIKEFHRVLKPGGKLYFTANNLGWFLFCFLEEHNKTANYDPRQMAADTIENSINYYSLGKHEPGKQLIIHPDVLRHELETLGFKEIQIVPEGHLNFKSSETNSFYKHTNYQNQGFIFEVHAVKI